MTVQAGINQSLSLIGFFASQNPALQELQKKRSGLRNLAAKEKNLNKKLSMTQPMELERLSNILTEGQAIAEEKYNIDPTEKNLAELDAAMGTSVADLHEARREADPAGAKAEDAMTRALEEQQHSQQVLAARNEEVKRSRDIAKMISEGTSFDASTYTPPESQIQRALKERGLNG